MKAFIVITLLLMGSGCLYKADLQQGNVISAELVEQLRIGMTKQEAIAVLGSPLLVDPFHTNRWDYYSYAETGRDRKKTTSHITLVFEENALKRIENKIEPEPISFF